MEFYNFQLSHIIYNSPKQLLLDSFGTSEISGHKEAIASRVKTNQAQQHFANCLLFTPPTNTYDPTKERQRIDRKGYREKKGNLLYELQWLTNPQHLFPLGEKNKQNHLLAVKTHAKHLQTLPNIKE